MLALLHSERPKLYAILAFLSAVGLMCIYNWSILISCNDDVCEKPRNLTQVYYIISTIPMSLADLNSFFMLIFAKFNSPSCV